MHPYLLIIKQSINFVEKQLKKLFSYLFGKKKRDTYLQPVIDAANNSGYIETYSNKADSLHLDIKTRLYEEDLQSSFISVMNKLAQHFRKGKARLAVDLQEHGFYGKTDSAYIIGTSYKGKSHPKAFKYITISILTGNKDERIPLYALPWHIGQDTVDSVSTLLKIVKSWVGKIEVIEFDRGLYSHKLVYWLNNNKVPYLIHRLKSRGYITDLIEKTRSFYRGRYEQNFTMNKTTYKVETNLYVCKNIDKKNWLFVSNIWFKNKWQPWRLYKNRWQIETNYAVHNSARIMSRSVNYLVRYFYYLVGVLLQVVWRLCACKIPFKSFLFSMVVGVKGMLERKPCFVRV